MGMFQEAGHNIGVFVITFMGIIIFIFAMLFIIIKFLVPIIQEKFSDFLDGFLGGLF